MPRPRSETTLDERGRARRTRERRAAELQALRTLAVDAEPHLPAPLLETHAPTIARARGATTTTATTED